MQVIPRPPGPQIGLIALGQLIIITIIALAVYMIHRHDSSLPQDAAEAGNSRLRPWMITAIMFVLAFYGPMSINISPGFGPFGTDMIYLFGMTYQIANILSLNITLFDLPIVAITALLSFMRPVFAYQLSRYFKGKTSRERTIVVGVMSELQMPLITGVMLLYLMTNPFTPFVYTIVVPLPVLLLLSLIFMWRIPVVESHGPWKEVDEPKEWWDEEPEKVSKMIFEDM
jgi:hypothetical protein